MRILQSTYLLPPPTVRYPLSTALISGGSERANGLYCLEKFAWLHYLTGDSRARTTAPQTADRKNHLRPPVPHRARTAWRCGPSCLAVCRAPMRTSINTKPIAWKTNVQTARIKCYHICQAKGSEVWTSSSVFSHFSLATLEMKSTDPEMGNFFAGNVFVSTQRSTSANRSRQAADRSLFMLKTHRNHISMRFAPRRPHKACCTGFHTKIVAWRWCSLPSTDENLSRIL